MYVSLVAAQPFTLSRFSMTTGYAGKEIRGIFDVAEGHIL